MLFWVRGKLNLSFNVSTQNKTKELESQIKVHKDDIHKNNQKIVSKSELIFTTYNSNKDPELLYILHKISNWPDHNIKPFR